MPTVSVPLTKTQSRRLGLIIRWMTEGTPRDPELVGYEGGMPDEVLYECAECGSKEQLCEACEYQAFLDDPKGFIASEAA